MDSTHIRLKQLRTSLQLFQRKFVKQIYISQGLYSEIELGKREAGSRVIQLIATQFNVSKEWLLKGEGEMFTAPPPDLELERLIEIYKELDDYLKHCLVEHSNTLLKIQHKKFEKMAKPEKK